MICPFLSLGLPANCNVTIYMLEIEDLVYSLFYSAPPSFLSHRYDMLKGHMRLPDTSPGS